MANSILIIDDDADIVCFIKSLLENADYEVIGAYNGKEGLEKVRNEKPILVLLDIMMPDMDGWEVLKRLKTCKKTLNIPICMFTACGDKVDIEKGYKEGAVDYITKPFHPDEFIERIKNIISIPKRNSSDLP